MSGGYFKNTVFNAVSNAVSLPQNTFVTSNENNIYFSSLYFYRNLITGVNTNFTATPATGNYEPTLDFNDVYINGHMNAYYKNANLINAVHSSEAVINDLKAVNGNLYMIRSNPNATVFNVYINGVITQTMANSTLDSSFNNITVVKL